MPDTALAAKKTVEVGKKQILDQSLRIERQLRLIARHERGGYPDLVADAVRMLAEMERALARMKAHYAKAQEHLAVTIDEPSLAKVERATRQCRTPSASLVVDCSAQRVRYLLEEAGTRHGSLRYPTRFRQKRSSR
jgi:hypothetical protein